MNIIDTSLWLEYFAGTEAGRMVLEVAGDFHDLIVPTVILYEVSKKLLSEQSEFNALKLLRILIPRTFFLQDK